MKNKITEWVTDNPVAYLFTKMWRYSHGNRKMVMLFWAMFIAAITMDLVVEPMIMSKVMNAIQDRGITWESMKLISLLLLAYIGNSVLYWALHGPARVMELNNAFLERLNYRSFFLRGLMNLRMQWHVDHHSGDTIEKIDKGTGALYQFSEETFVIVYSCIRLLVSYSVLIYFDAALGVIAALFLILSVFITMKIDKVLVQNYVALSRAENDTAKTIFDSLSNITTVIILRVEKFVFKSIINRIRNQHALTTSTNRLSEFKWFLTSMSCILMTTTILAYYLYGQVGASTPILIGSVYLLISYLSKIESVFFEFTGMYGNLVRYKVRVQNAEVIAADFGQHDVSTDVLPSDWKSISINNLCFSYSGSGEPQLCGLNLVMNRGQRIAFVGQSGSGKTTLLKLIRALYEPNSGRITVDGVLQENGFVSFGESVALVPQDPEIFDATILYNITLGADYTADQISLALRISRFDEVVLTLPKGLDSMVNEKGVNLSGGQRQRLALARAVLASLNKDVILFDEPTSSLDPVTESQVYQGMFDTFGGKLIVSTVHRLHLLRQFDQVVVFDKGRIIATGTLNELLQNESCPIFREMWDKQMDVQIAA